MGMMLSPGAIAAMQRVPGGASLTARYWRFTPVAWPRSTGTIIVGYIGLAASPGGGNLLTGGTSSSGDGNASFAFDTSLGNRWGISTSSAGLGNGWLKYDAGAPISPVEFFAQAGGNSGDGNSMPSSWLIENGSDDVTYFPVMIAEMGLYADSQNKTASLAIQDFTVSEANARAWEFQMTNSAGGDWFREATFHPTFGGSASTGHADFAYGTELYAYAGNDGMPTRLFDGNASSLFVCNTPTSPRCRVGIIRATPLGAMQEMRINPEGGAQPTAITARWSVDGRTFYDKKDFPSVSGFSNGTPKSFDLR